MSNIKPLSYSFPPIEDAMATKLILGSMPGAESLKQQQYYAHPRNAFWPIMAALTHLNVTASYQQRCDAIAANGIAVWDVLKACHRPGSLDQHIDADTVEANDFCAFFSRHPNIRAVFFNGAKAEQLFNREVLPELEPRLQALSYLRLPSTSPAHAAMTLQQKIKKWEIIQSY